MLLRGQLSSLKIMHVDLDLVSLWDRCSAFPPALLPSKPERPGLLAWQVGA